MKQYLILVKILLLLLELYWSNTYSMTFWEQTSPSHLEIVYSRQQNIKDLMHCGIERGTYRCIMGYILFLFNPTMHHICDIFLSGINLITRLIWLSIDKYRTQIWTQIKSDKQKCIGVFEIACLREILVVSLWKHGSLSASSFLYISQ